MLKSYNKRFLARVFPVARKRGRFSHIKFVVVVCNLQQDSAVSKGVACLPLGFFLPCAGSTDSPFTLGTKSCIVTPVVSQLGQSYLIKSSRGWPPFLYFLSSFPRTTFQVPIKLFLLLRLAVFISRRSPHRSQNRRIVTGTWLIRAARFSRQRNALVYL